MAESGSREKATARTAESNVREMMREGINPWKALDITAKLRRELEEKNLKGFKKGGKVKKTGVYKLHKGEKVITAKAAKKVPNKMPVRRAAPSRRGRR